MSILNLNHHPDFGELKITLNIHQKIILAFVLVNFIGLMYLELFHLMMGILDGLFELIEHTLDITVDYLLDTSTHDTQTIVFYILVPLILFALYHYLPSWYQRFKKNLHQQKLETINQWQELRFVQKAEWWIFFAVYLYCLMLFNF